jgi:hypothetical protein
LRLGVAEEEHVVSKMFRLARDFDSSAGASSLEMKVDLHPLNLHKCLLDLLHISQEIYTDMLNSRGTFAQVSVEVVWWRPSGEAIDLGPSFRR